MGTDCPSPFLGKFIHKNLWDTALGADRPGDRSSGGRIVRGMYCPWDVSSEGCIVLGIDHPRDVSSWGRIPTSQGNHSDFGRPYSEF
jgi:hypothetical protein